MLTCRLAVGEGSGRFMTVHRNRRNCGEADGYEKRRSVSDSKDMAAEVAHQNRRNRPRGRRPLC
jgi:hypothetical protein